MLIRNVRWKPSIYDTIPDDCNIAYIIFMKVSIESAINIKLLIADMVSDGDLTQNII